MSVTASHPIAARKQRKAATRRTLLEAGISCFETKGYAATGIADIARTAGVAHGTFYVHFESKDALLEVLLDDFNQELAAALSPVFAGAGQGSLETIVRQAAEVFLKHWQDNRGFVRCYAERSSAGLDLSALRDGVNPPMMRVLRTALQARAGDGKDAVDDGFALAAHALLAMWLRIGMQFLFTDLVSRQHAVDTLVRMSLGAVAALTEWKDDE